MPKPRALVTAVSLAAAREANFGVDSAAMVAALDDWIPCTEADFGNLEQTLIDDSDEINGYAMPTTQEVEMVQGTLARKYYLTAESLLWLLALQLGDVTTSAASSATNEVWTITVTGGATAGAFTLTWEGFTTDPIETSGLASTDIETAFEAHPDVSGTDFTFAGTGPFTITAAGAGAYAGKQLAPPVVTITETLNAVGTVVLTTTTEGGAAGVYTHEVAWPTECAVNPPSTEIMEGLRCGGSTATYKLLTGVVVDQVDIEISAKGWINLTASLKFKDEKDKGTFTFPASATLNRKIKGSKLRVFLGSALTSEVDNTILRSLKITISSGIVVPSTIGGDDTVPEFQYGEKKPDLAIELQIKGDKSSTYWDMKRQCRISPSNRFKFRMILQPNVTPQRKVQLDCNQIFVDANPDKEGNETRINLMLKPEANTTDEGPGKWFIESSQATLLAAL